ncbi:MAG: divalent metal cation transporter [Mesorhizobium sp.]|nr:MAG: divalent metal cation transporter [Mesorhizobium sp.]
MSKHKQDPVVGPSKQRLLSVLGPGLITGASDDDPSGIATYSQTGAQFGFALTWTMLFSYPLMSVVQEISARIGRTTGRGIAGNMRKYYPNWLLQAVVFLLLIANIINIGADLGAMADALKLIVGGPSLVYVVAFGAVSVVLQIFLKYSRYVSILKWLTLSLFAYFGTILFVPVAWGEVAWGLFIPKFTSEASFWTSVVAILGTTISPYLFFWQASQEVEDEKAKPERQPLKQAPKQAENAIGRIRLDTYIGMAFSNIVALAIIVTAGATLHANGVTNIESTSQAAEALKPVAGAFAFAIFALGVIGTGLLAIPVLAGSAGYALGEARKWPTGLDRKPLEAKAFYATIAAATLLGVCLNFTPVNPIKALYWSAVVNGVVAVPVMAVMMLMTARRDIMGETTVPLTMRAIGWIATAVMAAAAVVMIVQLFWA